MSRFEKITVVSLNPAIDRVVEARNFRWGQHQRVQRLARYPAGKAINVARAMGSLGCPPTVTGFVGAAEASWYREFLAEYGVVDCQLVMVDGPTRENISIVDPEAPGSDTHLVEQGFQVLASHFAELRGRLDELAGRNRLIVFSGSLPEGIAADAFRQLLQACLDRGAQTAVDSSGPSLATAVQLPLWLIKPNRSELSELCQAEVKAAAQQNQAAANLAQRIRWVLVSAGAEGAWLVNAQATQRAHLSLPDDQLVGTVGCGDVLLGGFLAAWQRDLPAVAALEHGVAAAALAATRIRREVDWPAVEQFAARIAAASDA